MSTTTRTTTRTKSFAQRLGFAWAEPEGIHNKNPDIEDYYLDDCSLASFGAGYRYHESLSSLESERSNSSLESWQTDDNDQLEEEQDSDATPPQSIMAAAQQLAYTTHDLKMLSEDHRAFDLLKRSLRKKGAVTNEVLKQKLPLFMSYCKNNKQRRQQQHRIRPQSEI